MSGFFVFYEVVFFAVIKIKVSVLLALLAALTAYAYFPGLYGPFLFDDFANLNRLGDLGGVRDWETFRAFVFGGTSGPTGRPISLLSFLLNAQDWPANPFWFKLTNLVIHIFNAALLFLVCSQLLTIAHGRHSAEPRVIWLALFVAGFWLLHPYLVSTTLYVVQRMAQLSAFFCLLGLLSYLVGRRRVQARVGGGYWLTMLVTPICWAMATFSKESGALLPVFVVLLELTLFAAPALRITENRFRALYALVFVMPALAIVGYLLAELFINDPWAVYERRGFSTVERLLSESRILFSYIGNWVYPEVGGGSLFNDDFQKSTGLFTPSHTIWAVFGHVAILAALVMCRRSVPLLVFCVGFFYAGHLLESTTIKLELYFDHRNYLPMAFLMLPLADYVVRKLSLFASACVGVATLSLLLFMTCQTASLWQSYESLVVSWAENSRESSRAQRQLSLLLREVGDIKRAISVVERYLDQSPGDFAMRLWLISLKCEAQELSETDVEDVQHAAPNAGYDLRALGTYTFFVNTALSGQCNSLQYEAARSIFEAHLEYPSNGNPRGAPYSQIHYLLGRLALQSAFPEAAVHHWKRSLGARRTPDAAMQFAAEFASAGKYDAALEFSSEAGELVQRGKLGASGRGKVYWLRDIAAFQAQVARDKKELVPEAPDNLRENR